VNLNGPDRSLPALWDIVGRAPTRWLGDGNIEQEADLTARQYRHEWWEHRMTMLEGFAVTGLLVQPPGSPHPGSITTAHFSPGPQQPDLPAGRPGMAAPSAEAERLPPPLLSRQGQVFEPTWVAARAVTCDVGPSRAAEFVLDCLQTALPSAVEAAVWVVPAAALPLQTSLPFDLQELKREVEVLFARLKALGEDGPYNWVTVRFAVGVVVLAVATYECVRRTPWRRSPWQALDGGPGFESATFLMDVS
jgi:hypothetical protein